MISVRTGTFLAVIGAVFLVACGDGDSAGAGRSEAISAVTLSDELGHNRYRQHHEGDNECVIVGGGPAPGIRVPATCRWEAERANEGWIVSLSEIWRCEDFNANIEGEETCPEETGSHTYRFRVNSEGDVGPLDDFGDFGPQSVQ